MSYLYKFDLIDFPEGLLLVYLLLYGTVGEYEVGFGKGFNGK